MPEAYSESAEVLGEVRRLRPHWLLERPPTGDFQRLYRDWRRNGTGFWSRVRKAPERVSEHVRQLQQGLLANARAETKAVRQSQIDNQFPIWRAPLDQYLTEVPKEPNGDQRTSVAAWRLDVLNFWSLHLNSLVGQPTPLSNAGGYIDWLSAEIDFHKAKQNKASWYDFWLFDASGDAMPRAWLRWTSGLLQQFSSWSRGTPGDNQMATYLVDADRFITADRAMFRIVQKLHADAPFPVASPILISADENGARETLEAIAAGGK